MSHRTRWGILLVLAHALNWSEGRAFAQAVEAESGVVLGSAAVYPDESATGGRGVAYISSPGAGFRIQGAPASSGIEIRYASALSGAISVFVGGELAGSVGFPSTDSWVGNYGVVSFSTDIPADSDFAIIFQDGDTAMNVDRLEFFGVGVGASNPLPDSDPNALSFGIDSEGRLFHVDGGWTAQFNYLCVNGRCLPGERTGGVFHRDVSTEVEVGRTVNLEFKVEDEGAQCLTGELRVKRQLGLTGVASPCAPTSTSAVDPPATPVPAPTSTPVIVGPRTPLAESDPDPLPLRAAFGIDAEGRLFHVDEGWSADFHYLCIEGDCRPGVRAGGEFSRDVSDVVEVGQSVIVEFKVEDEGSQCLTGPRRLIRRSELTRVESPCALDDASPAPIPTASPTPIPTAVPTPIPTASSTPIPTAVPTSIPTAVPTPIPTASTTPPGVLGERGAGLISISGDTITTQVAERFRDRHEGDLNHDTYIDGYASGSAYEIVLIDRPESLEVQVHSPQAPLSMVNLTYGHIVNPGWSDPPQYAGGAFMAKGSLSGPANDSTEWMAGSLYFELRSANGRPWSEVRNAQEIVTLEFTPRRELDGHFPQYYSDILRYRAGQGGITLEREDARYFSGGPTTNFAHGSPGFELSQPFLGIDQPTLHRFTLGREIFRASFRGEALLGNGGFADGAAPDAVASACADCHFQLGKAAPPGRTESEREGFINSGGDLRVAPSLIGLGLLEAVDRATIEEFAASSGGKVPQGRFGWKATEPTIRDQIQKAFALDVGVEAVSEAFVDRVEDYLRGLGVPVRRHPTAQAAQQPNTGLRSPDSFGITDQDVLDGEDAFREAQCAGCHIPEMKTGTTHPIRQFRNITIRPFTDLLLWDMGAELCASSDEGNADRCEWRTAPLWGLRLQEWVTGHATFLHDGRATTLDEAIRLHGGDAATARAVYEGLSPDRRLNLLLYLASL